MAVLIKCRSRQILALSDPPPLNRGNGFRRQILVTKGREENKKEKEKKERLPLATVVSEARAGRGRLGGGGEWETLPANHSRFSY